MNNRETYSNINLIKAVIVAWKNRFLDMKEMRSAITAFDLTAKKYECQNLPCETEPIHDALQLMGKTMSDKTIEGWVKKVR